MILEFPEFYIATNYFFLYHMKIDQFPDFDFSESATRSISISTFEDSTYKSILRQLFSEFLQKGFLDASY